MKETEARRENSDLMAAGVFGALLAYLTYVYVVRQLSAGLSDYHGHTYVFFPLYSGGNWLEGWLAVPYFLWHLTLMLFHYVLRIPVESAAAVVACVYTLLAYFVIYWMLQRVTEAAGGRDSSFRSAFLAFCLCIIQGIYLFWLDAGGRFLGIYSMNPTHNPTYTCVKAFSLICFCLVCDIWGRQKDENYRGIFFRVESGLRRYYFYLAAALFLSVMAKPTFAEMFIPAVAFLMLGELLKRAARRDGSAKQYFKHCLATLACAVPALLYILLQFLAYFVWSNIGGRDSVIVTGLFEVWHMYSRNAVLSMALGMAFPLFLLLVNGSYFVKSDMGKLALAGYLIGLAEAALLGESGQKLGDGNFLWPMMSGMLLMYMVSVMRLAILERKQADTGIRKGLIAAAWFLFYVQVVYGIAFLQEACGKILI